MSTTIIGRCGYVESNSTSVVIWSTRSSALLSKKDALKSLAGWLLEKFKLDTEWEKKKASACCLKAKTPYCGKCGKNVEQAKAPQEIDAEEFIQWYRDIEHSDCDSFGPCDEIESPDDIDWQPWGSLKHDAIYEYVENFQKELVETLGLEGETW